MALKITLLNEPPGAGHNFTFTAEPQPKALAERDAFQNELLNIIANNRSTTTPTAQSTPAPTLASASARNGGAVPPRATPALSARTSAATPMSRATSVVADGRSTTPFGADSAAEFRLRKNVLLANPDLANLHKELVMSGQINEADFWEGRSVRCCCYVINIGILIYCIISIFLQHNPRSKRNVRADLVNLSTLVPKRSTATQRLL